MQQPFSSRTFLVPKQTLHESNICLISSHPPPHFVTGIPLCCLWTQWHLWCKGSTFISFHPSGLRLLATPLSSLPSILLFLFFSTMARTLTVKVTFSVRTGTCSPTLCSCSILHWSLEVIHLVQLKCIPFEHLLHPVAGPWHSPLCVLVLLD